MYRKSRVVGAHFDTRPTYLSCGAVCVLLNRGPSWRHGARPQPVDPPQDLSEQVFGDSDLCKLERDVPTVPDHHGADLDQIVAQRGEGSIGRLLATSSCSDHVCRTESLPPKADLPWPMSGIAALTSGFTPTPDVGGDPG